MHFCSLPGSTELSFLACLSICGDEQPQFQDKGGIMFAIRISTILTVLYSCGLSTVALTTPDVLCRHDQLRSIPAIRDCFEAARQIPRAPGYSIHVSLVWPLTFRFGTCAIMVKPLDTLAEAAAAAYRGRLFAKERHLGVPGPPGVGHYKQVF